MKGSTALHKSTLGLVAMVALCCGPARAADPGQTSDPAANTVVRMFMSACIPAAGQPDKVREWAAAQHLQPIASPAALEIFVGPGGKGAAWAMPTPDGHFALSIRGTTQACAVWAQKADPAAVEDDFRKIIDGVKQPGLVVTADKDLTQPSPYGKARVLIYNIAGEIGHSGLEMTMMTAEKPGAAFQASLQMARVAAITDSPAVNAPAVNAPAVNAPAVNAPAVNAPSR